MKNTNSNNHLLLTTNQVAVKQMKRLQMVKTLAKSEQGENGSSALVRTDHQQNNEEVVMSVCEQTISLLVYTSVIVVVLLKIVILC